MKLSVFTVPLYHLKAEEAFSYLHDLGVQAVEIGTGGFPGNQHCPVLELLEEEKNVQHYHQMLQKYQLTISALSVHSNPLHPNKQIAKQAHEEFMNTCKLAQRLGVDTIVTFSGCPGDHQGAQYPNWVTCAWPDDFQQILQYQWEDCLIPYWRDATQQAAEYGIQKIALEMHPGFCVYNPSTLLRLRGAVGDSIGANVDPSHLFWQGIAPVEAIAMMKGAIYHFHAKDTRLEQHNINRRGVLDTSSFGELVDRSWAFCTVGYGHDQTQWKKILAALRLAGYDGAISIEHEDGLMSVREGLEKAVKFLKDILLYEDPAEAWWI